MWLFWVIMCRICFSVSGLWTRSCRVSTNYGIQGCCVLSCQSASTCWGELELTCLGISIMVSRRLAVLFGHTCQTQTALKVWTVPSLWKVTLPCCFFLSASVIYSFKLWYKVFSQVSFIYIDIFICLHVFSRTMCLYSSSILGCWFDV